MPSVIYTYGSPGAGNNRAGRIATVENGNMKEERSYGKMGETIRTTRSIKKADSWTSYEMKYAWDNLGRMTQLVYPDGEILSYTYNRGGLLKAATGRSKEKTETYVKEILYDEFGQRTKAEYGNGIKTEYVYDPLNHRLSNLKTKGADNKTYQNLTYEYDGVGNILKRTNNGFVTTDKTEKTATQSYEYDNMHRLTNSTGTYSNESWIPFNTTRTNEYTNQFYYDQIGNITQKSQTHRAKYADTGKYATIEETTYTLNYKYDGSRPHAVTTDGAINGADKLDQPRTYSYDDNGNMTAWSEKGTGRNRTMAWDEENRLIKVTDASITEFKYDDTGMRISKKGNAGEVLYVNPNYTIREGGIISKHVFAGNTRVASKVSASEAGGTYYYHADHLGSSSVVTNQNGAFHESLEYMPYGETWVHEKANSSGFSTPYQFCSKEIDPETGLYYHGARYRDARLNNWLSPDPILKDYLPNGKKEHDQNLPGIGGVYNPVNLNLYDYAGNNPVRYIDPDGRENKENKMSTIAEKVLANPKTVNKINEMRQKSNQEINYQTKSGTVKNKQETFTWIYYNEKANDVAFVNDGTPTCTAPDDVNTDGLLGMIVGKPESKITKDGMNYEIVGSIHTHPNQRGYKIGTSSEDISEGIGSNLDKFQLMIISDLKNTIRVYQNQDYTDNFFMNQNGNKYERIKFDYATPH